MNIHPYTPLTAADAERVRERWPHWMPLTHAAVLLEIGTEADWLAARRKHAGKWRIGASELAAVLDISPHASPFSLWWSKQDTWSHPETTTAQKLGHRFEELIGELWAETHPEAVLCRPGAMLFGHPMPEHEWLVCTPDFLAVVPNAAGDGLMLEPVECKSDEGGKGWGKPGTDQVPEQYRVQVYVQCEVLGAQRGHLMRLAGKKPAAYVLEYDEAAQFAMASWLRAGALFVQSLIDDVPPDLDGHKATTEALQQIHAVYTDGKQATLDADLIREFKGVEEMYDTVKVAREEVRNRIRAALGDAQIGTDAAGARVVKRNIYKRRGYEVGPAMVDELRRVS